MNEIIVILRVTEDQDQISGALADIVGDQTPLADQIATALGDEANTQDPVFDRMRVTEFKVMTF